MNALVKSHRRSVAVLLFLLCLKASSWAQPKAAFSATQVSGCSPLAVYFSDSSTGAPTQWRWELGNGVISTLRNPSATYFNPGTYTVKLVVSNGQGKDSIVKSNYITVYENPKPDFAQDKAGGCFPLTVALSDKSLPGSGSLFSWQWDFGDGTLATGPTVSHTYTTAGSFNITLKVTNSFGCIKSFTKEQAVTVTSGVKAAFSHTDPGMCPAPAAVQFTNTTSGPGPLTYLWSFGDGNTSTSASPSHTYTGNGNYTVSLIATSPQGCADTLTRPALFAIGMAKADFTAPAAACVNEAVTFNNTSVPSAVSVHWDFGDGTTSTATQPVKIYATAGTFAVQLISNFGGCADTVKKNITVSAKPVANFSASQQAFCALPATVSFTSLSKGSNLSYHWDFGDGSSDSTANPAHTYTKEGAFTVRLLVSSNGGCSDLMSKQDFIQIQKPQISIEGLPRNGCAPIALSPKATITGNQKISSYRWDFGDGATSTEPAPTHVYGKAGNYDIRLIATTGAGCSDTILLPKAVRVGEKPHADFSLTPAMVCPYEQVSFTDKSSGKADQWLWDFGDGSTSVLQSPTHQYGDTGWHDVRLIVFNNTCPDTLVIKKAVHVNPPFALFAVQNDCKDKYTKKFTDQSIGPEIWFWEFGDGSTSSSQNPQHTYAASGTYQVKLTVTNGSCSHSLVQTVRVIDETADFTMVDSVLCRNSTAQFNASGINSGNIKDWAWNFGDGAGSIDTNGTRHVYTDAGRFTVSLSITDLLGCTSTRSRQVTVYGPTASFTPSVAATCLKNNNVLFAENSTTDTQHAIVGRLWDFGDGTVDSTATPPYRHSYQQANTYTVSLTVKDNFGCRDTKTIAAALIIAQPVAAFTVSDTASCTGKTIQFTNASTAISPAYQWSFGDGNQSALASPSYAYNTTGAYSIGLWVTDKYGCRDSVFKPNLVTIAYPKAAFSLSDSIGTCPPLLVHFTNRSSDYKSIRWDFGDGNTSVLDTPSHFYSFPGTYYATLLATGPGGCTDTVRKKIVVKGPTGTFTYAPLTGCKPLTVTFNATTKNEAAFIWDFSDGATEASSQKTIAHTYVEAGDFVPRIILTDAAGCSVPIMGADTVRVKSVSADFSLDASRFCNEGMVQFNSQTVSNDLITGYQWNFGDGSTGTSASPQHRYTQAGRYTVQLLTTTQTGCTDKKTLTDTVTVYPSPIIAIAGDTAACAPAKLGFTGQIQSGNASLLQWNWDLANGTSAALQNPAAQTYSSEGFYTIRAIATNNHGCADTAIKAIRLYPVPATNAGPDSWICRGSVQPLNATGAERYQWQPVGSLSCTNCAGPLAAPADSTQYVVTGYNGFGCSKTDSVIVRVHQPFRLSVEKGDTVCAGQSVRLAASGTDQYTWLPSEVKDPRAAATTAAPRASTTYTVVATDNAHCFTDSAQVYVKVWPMPGVDLQEAETLQVGGSLQLTPKYTGNIASYQWNNAQTLSCANCPSPVARPKTETKYTVEVKNEGGCSAKASMTVHVICNNGNLFIPNTFSPNTDGQNDRFFPRGSGISRIKSLKIFNRWGELVYDREDFNANDASAGWDGSYKGQRLTADVFVYTCEVVCMNNEVLTFRGDLTLLR